MKFIPSRDLRIRPGQVWKQLRKEKELIITSNGKPVALMTPVTEDNLEEELQTTRRAHEALKSLQEDARRRGLKFTQKQIDEIIRKARKDHRG